MIIEVFSLPIIEPSLCFTNVKIIAILTTRFVNEFGSLRAVKVVLVWKQRLNAAGVLTNYLEINTRVKLIKTAKYGINFKAFRNLVALKT